MHHVGGLILQRLMRAFAVVKGEVLRQADQQLSHGGVALQIHVLVLDTAPQSLHKNIVKRSAASIHA